MSIFLIIGTAITAVSFFSFTSEIRKNVLSDRKNQLEVIESTVSKRLEELRNISYEIGQDDDFQIYNNLTEFSGERISEDLSRYIAGNSFVEHLAFFKPSDGDIIYTSRGSRPLLKFFTEDFGMPEQEAVYIIESIKQCTLPKLALSTFGKVSYFAYTYPLPELSSTPQAYVLMLIPTKQVLPIFEPLVKKL